MSNILAISVSLKYASFALETDNGIIEGELHDDTPTFFVGAVRDFLSQNGLKFQDLDRIIVNSGPGSFTGIRVAISFAKAIKEVLGIQVIPVNLFEVLKKLYGNAELMVINSENPNEVYLKEQGKEAESCKNEDFDKSDFNHVIVEKNCPLEFMCKNISICKDLRKARNLLLLKDNNCNTIEPFYIKPPYAVKK